MPILGSFFLSTFLTWDACLHRSVEGVYLIHVHPPSLPAGMAACMSVAHDADSVSWPIVWRCRLHHLSSIAESAINLNPPSENRVPPCMLKCYHQNAQINCCAVRAASFQLHTDARTCPWPQYLLLELALNNVMNIIMAGVYHNYIVASK